MNAERYREAEQRVWQANGAAPVERQLRLSRLGVTARVLEFGQGQPLLFVHGGNVGGSSWAALAARLGDFHCIVLDRPGCGLSEPLPSVLTAGTLPGFAESLVVDVLDALELESAHVVATSFGGYIAMHAAAAHPGRVRRMVQLGWPFGASRKMPAFMRMTSLPGLGRLMAAAPVNARAIRMIYRGLGHGPTLRGGLITQGDIEWFISLLRDTDTMRNETAPGRAFISPLRGLNERILLTDSLLGSITTPSRFIWGESDPFGGPDIARRLVARMPNAELDLLPAAGHAPWLDKLDHCVAATREFFRA